MRRVPRAKLVVPATLFAVAVVSQLLIAHLNGRFPVRGQGHCLLTDDAMITQRYARNLVRGHGPVLNPGERVEGFSSPVMLFAVAAPVELVASPRWVGLPFWILNAILCGWIAALIAGWGREGGGAWPRALAALAFVALPHHAYYAGAGLSVYLQGLCLLLVARNLERGGGSFRVGLALLPLTHAICLPLWLGCVAGRLWVMRRHWPGELLRLGLGGIPLGAYLIFRLAYYGELFPNTYHLRSGGVMDLGGGINFLLEAAVWVAPVLAAGIWLAVRHGSRHKERLALLAVCVGPYLLYVATLGGDNHPWYRLTLPLLPLLLAAVGVAADESSPAPRWARLVPAGLLAGQLAVCAYGFADYRAEARATGAWLATRATLGQAIARNTEPDDVIALFTLGHMSYFSNRPVIDMLGRADRHIALTSPKLWRKIAHQKDDPAYVLAREPAYVQSRIPGRQHQSVSALERQRMGRMGYEANLALDEHFAEGYVQVTWLGRQIELYARRGSAAAQW